MLVTNSCSFSLKNAFDTIADAGRALKIDANNMAALQLRAQAYYSVSNLELEREKPYKDV